MIVDPIRHITDILALGGMAAFGFLLARVISTISDAIARTDRMASERKADEPVLQPAPVRANDNLRDSSGRRLAA